jgi:hypothetical protein
MNNVLKFPNKTNDKQDLHNNIIRRELFEFLELTENININQKMTIFKTSFMLLLDKLYELNSNEAIKLFNNIQETTEILLEKANNE